MGHGIVKLYCFNVSIERCRGTLFCARCPGTHQLWVKKLLVEKIVDKAERTW